MGIEQEAANPFKGNAAVSAVSERKGERTTLFAGIVGAGHPLCDQLGNFSAINYAIRLSYTVINRSVWQELSPQQQATMTEAAKRTADTSRSNVQDRIEANYVRMRESKMTLNLSASAA